MSTWETGKFSEMVTVNIDGHVHCFPRNHERSSVFNVAWNDLKSGLVQRTVWTSQAMSGSCWSSESSDCFQHTGYILSRWQSAGFFWQASMGTLEPRGGWTRYCCNEYPLAIRTQIGGTYHILLAYFSGLNWGYTPNFYGPKYGTFTYLHQLDPGDLPLFAVIGQQWSAQMTMLKWMFNETGHKKAGKR